jgi:hypothetical protein
LFLLASCRPGKCPKELDLSRPEQAKGDPLGANVSSDVSFHSFLPFLAFGTRCVSNTARGRNPHPVMASSSSRRTEGTTRNANAVVHADGSVVQCTILEDAPFWHKSCNIVKSSF